MPPTDPTRRFAANLHRQRTRAGLSQERLARDCGLHRSEISLLERGGREPRLSTIVRLASALGISAAALLDDGGDAPSEGASGARVRASLGGRSAG